MTPEAVKEALARLTMATAIDDGVRVSTHVLYPSNGAVTVAVRGGADTFVISDEGGAVGEMISAGIRSTVTDRLIKTQVRGYGLLVQEGAIFSPRVPLHAVPAAILLVANASRVVADWALGHLHFQAPRNFRADLAAILDRHFHDNLKHDTPIVGASNKPHKFTYVLYLSEERRLLIDPAVPEASSINARVVANMDVRMAKHPHLEQLIVYDDRMKWNSSDLRLLEVGAQTVPFSLAEPEIIRRAAFD